VELEREGRGSKIPFKKISQPEGAPFKASEGRIIICGGEKPGFKKKRGRSTRRGEGGVSLDPLFMRRRKGSATPIKDRHWRSKKGEI